MPTIPRVHISTALADGVTVLPDEAVERYLLKTLRLSVGAVVYLFDGTISAEWKAVIETVQPLRLRLVEFTEKNVESALHISVALCICKAEAMEYSLQKLTELGANRLILLNCTHSTSHGQSNLNENRLRRLHRIAVEASEQCGRVIVPELNVATSWQQFSRLLHPGLRIVLKERGADVQPLCKDLGPTSFITVLVGPEGGFASQELDTAIHTYQFIPVHLGPRILRCETAVLSAVSLCQAIWGDFSGDRMA
ncbi:MAG: 16S rRNA (uracil(1498)-N(3))-methyltransferase [Magnetococcales bacterium]|nr:16S rRNA (uracil(1498)-N(3))-methyltransferase [Magnetococcales bacterium]MBF0114819.1 16S rRNA (uracil(1498)-N(3))-methyltransferase [Magnetococcales bacterium]